MNLLLSKNRADAAADEAVNAKESVAAPAASVPAVRVAFTDADHVAWINHLRERRPSNMKRGLTLQQEFEQWKEARLNARAMETMAAAGQ